MDEWAARVVTGLIPLGPLVALLVLWLGRRTGADKWGVQSLCGGAVGMALPAAVALAVMAADQWPDTAEVVLLDWLRMDSESLRVELAFSLDAPAALLLMVLGLASAGIAVHRIRTRDMSDTEFFTRALLILLGTALLVLSTNLLMWLVFWQLTTLAGSHLVASPTTDPAAAAAARRMILVQRAVDVLFVLAVAMTWVWLGTLDFSQLADHVATQVEDQRENPFPLWLISVGLLAAVAGRCAQFPFFGWLHDLSPRPATVNALVQGAALMPVGILLLVRCRPILDAATSAGVSIFTVLQILGIVTALLGASIALTAPTSRLVLSYATVSVYGWLLLGVGTSFPEARVGTLLLLVTHVLAGAVLWLTLGERQNADSSAADWNPPRGSQVALLACLMLASGYFGQQRILSPYWQSLNNPPALETSNPASGPPHSLDAGVAWLIVVLGLASAFLLSLALFRAWCRVARHDHDFLPSRSNAPLRTSSTVPWILVLMAFLPAILVVGFPNETRRLLAPHSQFTTDPLLTTTMVFIVLLGIIAAWLLSARPSPWPERIAGRLGPFARMSRHRFYVDDLFSLGVELPLRGLAQLSRFFNWLVIDGLLVGLPRRLAPLPARLADPLHNGSPQFYGLTILLAATVLLTMLLAR